MVSEILYIVDKYFNLGILGMVFSALFVIMAVIIVVYNALWCNELRLVKGYRQATLRFAQINHIDEYNKRLFEKNVIRILPSRVRKAWKEMIYYNSASSKEKLKKAIECDYDMGTFIGIIIMLTTYIVSGILMVISGAINVDFNSFHGFAMGIALVIGAFCVLVVVIQMCYISAKYAEVTTNIYDALCDRVAKTSAIIVPVDNANVNCAGKIVLMNADISADSTAGITTNCGTATQQEFISDSCNNAIKTSNKTEELVSVIKEFVAANPTPESLEEIKSCLEETLGFGYCDNAERKKLLLAKLLLD